MKTELTFYLPVTRARLRATMRRLIDSLEPERNATETASWSAELVTVADTSQARTLAVESGILRDYGLKLTLTEDGRLASAAAESTGQVGAVLASAAGLATSIAAAAVFRFPVSVPSTPPVVTKGGSAGPADTSGTARPASVVEQRYLQECPVEAQQLAALQGEHTTAAAKVAEARRQYLEVGEAGRTEAWNHYRRMTRLLTDVSNELARSKTLFDAWRHSHQTTTEYIEAITVEVSALPRVSHAADGKLELTWGSGDQADQVHRFFERTKYVLARTTVEEWLDPPAVTAEVPGGAALRVRRPRSVGLASLHQDAGGVLWLVDERCELTMDAACSEVTLPLRRSWLARRKTAVELSPLGALTSVELGGDAAGAAATAGLAGMSTSAMAALESAQKARTGLTGLAAAGEEDELAQLKRETAIVEQRLLAAGQAATETDFARLAWLQQQSAIAEAQAKLGRHS